jgi:hypothetical protein
MTEKPSRNEEEYFAKREAELRKERHEAAAQEAASTARKAHYMKCPKCGADLSTEDYHGIQVDRCTECHGVWFDAGEAEALLETEAGGVVSVFRSIMRGVGGS